MEKNEILENNKLIADFLKWNNPEGTVYITDHYHYYMAVDSNMYETNRYRLEGFKFYNSWDWLMPVVEKIESLGYPIKITSKYCSIARDYTYKEPIIVSEFRDSKIKKVYDIIIGFIKYYNSEFSKKSK